MTDLLERLKTALTDRYVIERQVGSGGMATVYLAEDQKHHRKVAIKVLHPNLAATLGPGRFLQEIEVAAQLQHPHILPLHDSGDADGFLYYVMPYVEGQSLRDRLAKEGELPIVEAVRIVRDVVDALTEAHSNGVVHRDIKPENILLRGRHALVTDFGVAKAVSEATGREQLTTAGVALGTPTYMAPEQATADPHLDHRVDIYAVGAVAYELLTGRPVFMGTTPQMILSAHVTEAPKPVGQLRESVPAALESVVMRCLEKKPADRWQSAEELLPQLEALATPSGGVTPTDTLPMRARTGASKSWRVGGAAAAIVVAAVLFILTRGSAPTPMVFGQTTQVTLDEGLEMDPAFSPDGRMIAYAAGPTGSMRIFVKGITGGEAVQVTRAGADPDTRSVTAGYPHLNPLGDHRMPRWSPDGSELLFHVGGAVYVVPALGGTARAVVPRPSSGARGYATWSPDGTRIAYVEGFLGPGDTSAVYLQSVDGGDAVELAHGLELHTLAWSPDGRFLAAVSGNYQFAYSPNVLGNLGPSALVVISIDRGETIQVTDRQSMHMSPAWMPDSRSLLLVSTRDGGRDIYRLPIGDDGRSAGDIERLTAGVGVGLVGAAKDGSQIAYTVFTNTGNIWSIAIPSRGATSVHEAVPVTRGTQHIEGISVSPDGQWLAFDSDRSGNADIFKMAVDGSQMVQLTTNPHDDFIPSWSDDGEWIAFHSWRNGNRDVFVIPSDGGTETQVTFGPAHEYYADWSPDGSSIVYFHNPTGVADVYTVKRTQDGWGVPARVTTDGGMYPKWAPDGIRIVYVVNGDAKVLDIEDGEPTTIFDGTGLSTVSGPLGIEIARDNFMDPIAGGELVAAHVDWSPDGSSVFVKAVDSEGRASFWAADPSGGIPRLLVRFDDPARPSGRREFATDGKHLYFTIENRQSDIWVVEVGEGR